MDFAPAFNNGLCQHSTPDPLMDVDRIPPSPLPMTCPLIDTTAHRLLTNQKAVYGRVEGMYSRSQLLSSLAEQKEHTHRLMKRVDELVGELGDMEVRTRINAGSSSRWGQVLRMVTLREKIAGISTYASLACFESWEDRKKAKALVQ